MIHRILDLETVVLDRSGTLLKELASAASRREPYRESLRNDLLRVTGDIERLTTATERQSSSFTAEDAELALGSLGRVVHTWGDLNHALAHAAGLAERGKLDESYQALAAAASFENLEERLGLEPLRVTLREIVASLPNRRQPKNGYASAPPPAALSAEDPYPACLDAAPEAIEAGLLFESAAQPEQDARRARREARSRIESAHTAPGLDFSFPLTGADSGARFDAVLQSVSSADELESHDALVELLSSHRDALIVWLFRSLGERKHELESVLTKLARRADLVLMSDTFARENMKLFELLANATPGSETAIFRRLVHLFRVRPDGQPNSSDLLLLERDAESANREVLLRALLLHPLSVYRRYAISQLAPSEFWPMASYPRVPLVPLVDVMDRLALEDVSDDYRKAFFDCIAAQLESASGELELRATRRIMHRLVALDFFIEDRYYDRLLKLNETLAAEESELGLENWLSGRSMELLKTRREKSGARPARPPASLAEIPLVVQRKLARQGTYLHVFLRHPDPRIALETLRFIDTPAKAEAVLKLKALSPDVVARLAAMEDLFTSHGARIALLAHPRVTVAAVQKHVRHMRPEDMERLTTLKDTSPEVARFLRNQLARLRPASAS